MLDLSNQTSSKSISPTNQTRPFYRLERRESGKLSVIFDGLTLVECYDICEKIAGLHIRFSYNATSEVAQ